MEEIVGQVKWTTTNHTKGQSSSKEGDVVYMVGLEGNPLLWAPSGTPNDFFFKHFFEDFPGGPVVKNLPSNAGYMGSIPGQGSKIPHAAGQLSPRATTTWARTRTREKPAHRNKRPDAAKNLKIK